MNNRNYIIAALVIAVIVIAGGGFYFLSSKKPATQAEKTTSQPQEEVIPTINPDELGLVFEFNENPKAPAVRFTINNIKDIEHVEYEVTYTAQVDGNTVSQGFNGEVAKSQFGSDKITIKYKELGTCSAVCRYDKGVSSLKLILKIIKKDGKVYSSEKTLEI